MNNRFDCPEPLLTLQEFMRRVSEIESDLDDLFNRRLLGAAKLKLQNCFVLCREKLKLLHFLYYPGVPPTNK